MTVFVHVSLHHVRGVGRKDGINCVENDQRELFCLFSLLDWFGYSNNVQMPQTHHEGLTSHPCPNLHGISKLCLTNSGISI